ncbi:MAG: bifunctional phosphoglucose/phosphomannose isomerase [Thermoplasmataceae archaeon]
MSLLEEIRSLKDQTGFNFKFNLDGLSFDRVIYAGMGGSGIAGSIFSQIFRDREILVWNDYGLPEYAGKESIVIAASYSGNTEETVSSATEAKRRGVVVLGMGTGGRLEGLCDQWIRIPSGKQPRSSLGYFMSVLVRTFMREEEMEGTYEVLEELDNNNSFLKDIALQISKGEKIPVIYSFRPYQSVAYRWRTQFNENSKVIAFSHYFPELDHNEITGLWKTYGKDRFFFLLAGKPSEKRLADRIRNTMELTETRYVTIEEKGKNVVSRTLYLVHCGDYLSYHLAMERGIDPEDVSVITRLKQSLEPAP